MATDCHPYTAIYNVETVCNEAAANICNEMKSNSPDNAGKHVSFTSSILENKVANLRSRMQTATDSNMQTRFTTAKSGLV